MRRREFGWGLTFSCVLDASAASRKITSRKYPARLTARSPIARGPIGLQPGHPLGPYEILTAIGAGGLGEVYRTRDAKPEVR
jgi:hypothetical protein